MQASSLVPVDMDEALEAEYNSLLDDMVLLVAQKGDQAMRMSLEDANFQVCFGMMLLTTLKQQLRRQANNKEKLNVLANYVNEGLCLGQLLGNRFAITLRKSPVSYCASGVWL
ncbi:uncharacterized protein LOC131616769 [Vicia villosa]|uniref:uncharacterized protein LOC131616769 n=1 Tax=Vicia villosa TaxID=3911 RepID=UPI00273B849B|nr:uncharacterized protein LOC131616769 [Vicia villosa]XP_058744193.1 uncharacterized protein LOC131616769 [Vicia villosa]